MPKNLAAKIVILILTSALFSSCGQLKAFTSYTQKDQPKYVFCNFAGQNSVLKDTIKVVSYNIKHAEKTESAIAIMKQYKELADADIVFLQEMTPDATQKIAAELGYNYVFYPAIRHPLLQKDFGNAILSKWPLSDEHKIILSSTNGLARQRIAVRATSMINGQKISLVSVHMGIFVTPKGRNRLVETIIENTDPDITQCIVGGDFNSFTEKGQRLITAAFNQNAFNLATVDVDWTFKQWFFFNRKIKLDHIYTKGLGVLKAGKIAKRTASDHCPIWAELSLKNTRGQYRTAKISLNSKTMIKNN